MKIPTKRISEIEGMSEYGGYIITANGEVYSTKYNKPRKLKYGWAKKKDTYLVTRLTNGKGKVKNFYIHRLVALAFLPNPNHCYGIEHINSNLHDNRLENLRWITKKTINPDLLLLGKDMSDYIKRVHYACILKGVPVPTDYEFFHGILNESLSEYINRYGLRKTIHQLENHQT
jgi:hypothetical protein